MADKSTELVKRAASRGVLSPESVSALDSVDAQVTKALTGSYADTSGGEVILITMQIDDSTSMDGEPAAGVIQGHNDLVDKMYMSPFGQRTLLQTRCLSGKTINPFSPFVYCQRLNGENYQAHLDHTPLFGETLVTLGAVLTKAEEQIALGSRARSGTLIMSDGQSTEWGPPLPVNRVASLIADMQQVGDHIVAAMGFGDPQNYWASFRNMGIPPELIFSANNREGILRAFRLFGSALLELTSGKEAALQVFGS